ncbi:hypothetical protein [Oligoflexus tunisiensis]|uniref:hypothetical protein n=1 Tax=Oligoflexus tunisiensis TaxID=708132 RepID=UPI00114D3C05|nr:hypothetical protein [Oligoflexus tunisiensis]
MKKSALLSFAILTWGLLVFSPGCGTDVGNSGKPVTGDGSDLAAVVAMQHDEVISSINDGSDSSATPLALHQEQHNPALADGETTCTENTDGSINVKVTLSLAFETEYGRPVRRKLQKDTFDTMVDMNYAVPGTLGALACNNNRPVLSWAQLAALKTRTQLNKSRKRSVTLKADGSTLSESDLTVNSERTVEFSRVSSTLDPLTVQRKSTFSSTVSLLRQNRDVPLTRSIATLADEPIILEKTRTRGAGVTRVEIISGAVTSTDPEAETVILRYRNLVLSLGSSCHPSSGSVEGQVFANGSDTTATASFTLVFDSDGATLIHNDGTEEDLALEGCQVQ